MAEPLDASELEDAHSKEGSNCILMKGTPRELQQSFVRIMGTECQCHALYLSQCRMSVLNIALANEQKINASKIIKCHIEGPQCTGKTGKITKSQFGKIAKTLGKHGELCMLML